MKTQGGRVLALTLCLTLALSPAALAGRACARRGTLSCVQLIAPAYEAVGPVSEGRAAVCLEGKWGYVDLSGAWVAQPQYDLACPFREGLAVVGTYATRTDTDGDGTQVENPVCLYGFVNREGTYTPFTADSGGAREPYFTYIDGAPPADLVFHQGFALLPGDRLGTVGGGLLDSALTPDGPMDSGLCPGYDPAVGGACGYLNESGQTVLHWDSGDWDYFGEAGTGALGQQVRSYRYIGAVLPFDQGLAPAWQTTYDAAGGGERSLLGFLDTFGRWAIPPSYTGFQAREGRLFHEGLAVVKQRGAGYGAVDRGGRVVLPFTYEELQPCSEGLLAFREGGRYGFVSSGGALAVPARYARVSPFRGGLSAVTMDDEQALLDRYGNALELPAELEGADLFARCYDGGTSYLWTQTDGRYALGRLDYLPPLPVEGEMDAWALAEVRTAVEEGLVSAPLLGSYRSGISREEFCTLVVGALCAIEGKDREALVLERTGGDLYAWTAQYPFKDTSGADVIAAYALGIVGGRGKRTFDPAAAITRQEAAAYLARTAELLGLRTHGAPAAGYADGDAVGDWFSGSVDFVSAAGIMGGVGGGKFHPLGTYTREQSYATILRLLRALEASGDEAGAEQAA